MEVQTEFWLKDRQVPIGRPRRNLEDRIKKDVKDVGLEGVVWTDLAQDSH
jgi:hypothetical protein